VTGGELSNYTDVAASVVFNGSAWDQSKIVNLPFGLAG